MEIADVKLLAIKPFGRERLPLAGVLPVLPEFLQCCHGPDVPSHLFSGFIQGPGNQNRESFECVKEL